MISWILKEFPELTEHQLNQFKTLDGLYRHWNEKVNVISRKDIDQLYVRHIGHALALGKILNPVSGTRFCDLGSGGGIPGIPLAILWPQTEWILVDSIQKKMHVVEAIAKDAEISNVRVIANRIEAIAPLQCEYVVTRGVAPLFDLVQWSRKHIKRQMRNAMPNGLFAYKGGDLRKEIAELGKKAYTEVFPLDDWGEDGVFAEKSIVYVQM